MFGYVKQHGLKASVIPYCRLFIDKITFLPKKIYRRFKLDFEKKLLQFISGKNFRLKNIVVFECESDMDDNPRALYEYMLQNNMEKKYHLVWIVKNIDFCRKNYAHKNVEFISRSDYRLKSKIRFNYIFATAKWFVFSHPPIGFEKRNEKQFVLNTWHGVGLKADRAGDNKFMLSYDYVLVPSELCLELQRLIWREKQVYICEYPRTRFLLNYDKNIINKILPNLNNNSKIILSMPTFRQADGVTDSSDIDRYSLGVIDNEQDFKEFNSYLQKNNIYMIVKLHPLQRLDVLDTDNLTNIIYLTNDYLFKNKILLYNLLACADALLTDVSSVYVDFMLLDRPIGFYVDNFENYERGYLTDSPYDYMPGDLIKNKSGLYDFCDNLLKSIDNHKAERNKLCPLLHNDLSKDFCGQLIEFMGLQKNG